MLIKTAHKDFDEDGLITGDLYVDYDETLYLYGYDSKFYVSATLGLTLDVDSTTYTTGYFILNTKNYWSGGGLYLWWDSDASKYTISSYLGYGTESTDSYWTRATIEGTYAKQGTAASDKTVAFDAIVGWESATLIGSYTAVGGETGTKTVGLKNFTDGDAVAYLQSAVKSGSYFTYGSIYHDGTGWVIGTRSVGEWWSGTEPDVTTPVTFTAEGDAVANKTITFDSYVSNSNKVTGYLMEVATYV